METTDPSRLEALHTSAPAPRQRWDVRVLWLAPVVFLAGILLYGMLMRGRDAAGPAAPQIGQPLADFTLADLQGQTRQLAALRGKVVFMNVWATWCPPCIEEMPTIQRLHAKLQPRGLEILAVSIDALGAQVVTPFIQSNKLTFPVLLDPKSSVQRLYHTKGVPESFIVDKQGRLVEKMVGPRDWASPQMLALFERLLSG
jgi:peroxiredoxin